MLRRAADIEAVILHVQRTVAEVHHVELHTEVRIVGDRMSLLEDPAGARRARTAPRNSARSRCCSAAIRAEREISLLSGNAVLAALQASRRGRARIRSVRAAGAEPARARASIAPGSRCMGRAARMALMQGALEWLGIPYTGSGVLASALTMDKLKTKRVVVGAGQAAPNMRCCRSRRICRSALAARSVCR